MIQSLHRASLGALLVTLVSAFLGVAAPRVLAAPSMTSELLAPVPAPADEPKLRIGDKAPRLSGLDWLQRSKVNSFKRGTVYVIDFWSPVGRARASHQWVSEVLRQHPGAVEAVGVVVPPPEPGSEDAPSDEPSQPLPPLEEQVAQLVAASSEVLSYPLAVDEKGRSSELFREDAGCADLDLPLSMVVDGRGRLAWIGAADDGLADCVTALLADDWDLDAARDAYESVWAERLAVLEEMEFVIESVNEARWAGRDQAAFDLVQRLADRDPMFVSWRLELIRLLRDLGRADEVHSEVRRVLDSPAGRKPFELIELAQELSYAAPEGYDRGADLELALQVAQRAVELNRHFDPDPLHMLAKVHAYRGEWDEAVAAQTEAFERAPEFERESLGATLGQFRELRAGGRLGSSGVVLADGPADLRIGDRAPSLDGLEWLQGRGLRSFSNRRVYVLDFWAPWCAPCIASIPLLDRIARERGPEVEVLGLSIWPEPRGETTAEFLGRFGDQLSYPVADDVDGRLARDYMNAARRNGIPTSMVVDRSGRIAWIGWPDEQLEAVLDAVLADTWDLDAARESYESALEAEQALARLESEHRDLIESAWDAEAAGDHALAAERARELMQLDPLFEDWRVFRYRMLMLAGEREQAVELGDAVFAGPNARDARALGEFVGQLGEPGSGLEGELLDREFTLRLATRAVELSSRRDAWLLSMLGAVHGSRAEWAQGVAVFEEALELPETEESRMTNVWIRARLAEFRERAAAGNPSGG